MEIQFLKKIKLDDEIAEIPGAHDHGNHYEFSGDFLRLKGAVRVSDDRSKCEVLFLD